MKPKVLVFSGYGLNCEEETKFAFELAGAKADIVHINDLVENKKLLGKYKIMAFPGGFAYGDDTGAGNAYANKLRNNLWDELVNFIQRDTLTIGICNGFQIVANLGLLPAFENKYGKRQIALLANNSARYTVRWVDLKSASSSPWLKGIKTLSIPIAHGEGRLYARQEIIDELKRNKQIALIYVNGGICDHFGYEANPNGSELNIAGLTDPTGRVLGLMPHPERGMFFTQLPHWTYLKEQYLREGKKLPKYADGLKIFNNAVRYFS